MCKLHLTFFPLLIGLPAVVNVHTLLKKKIPKPKSRKTVQNNPTVLVLSLFLPLLPFVGFVPT